MDAARVFRFDVVNLPLSTLLVLAKHRRFVSSIYMSVMSWLHPLVSDLMKSPMIAE